MNPGKKIIYLALAAVAFTATAVFVAPEMELVRYVLPLMGAGLFSLVCLTAISFYLEGELNNREKSLLMNAFLLAILVPSFFAAAAFVHESETSWSNGEIHWHADFEVFVDDGSGNVTELDLVDPAKFCEDTGHESSYMCKVNDRTGSTEYHEHNDDRIHLEGTFKTRDRASLAAFFGQFYGEITNNRLVFPTNDGEMTFDENAEKSVKILVQKGVGGSRGWCAVGTEVKREDICMSHGELATSPDKYVISSYTQNPRNSVILDTIYIVYDSKTTQEALQDVRKDGKYRGKGITKEGGGYDE